MKKCRLTLLMLPLMAGMWGGMATQSDAMDAFFRTTSRNFTRSSVSSLPVQEPFSVRYQYDKYNRKYFQPEQTDAYYPLSKQYSTWTEYCQSFQGHDISEACFIFEEVAKIGEFLQYNRNIQHLDLVNPRMGDRSVVNLDFLNESSGMKSLRLCYFLGFDNPKQTIDLSNLQFLRKLCDDTGSSRPSNIVFPPNLESVQTSPHKIDRLPLKITGLKLSGRDREPVTPYLSELERFQFLRNLDTNDFDLDTKGFETLRNLSFLKSLNLYKIGEEDLKYLAEVWSLESLKVSYYEAKSLIALSRLPLKTFEAFRADKLSGLFGFEEMSDLEYLSLGWAKNLLDLKEFRYWTPKLKNGTPKLKKLSLPFARSMTSLRGLEGLPIEDLEITFSKIEYLDVLRTLQRLKYLDLTGNYPLGWEGLRNHPSLERLRIGGPELNSASDYCDSYGFPSNPFDVLKTIPNLKLINVELSDITTPRINDFRIVRSNVDIKEYCDWKNVVLPKE